MRFYTTVKLGPNREVTPFGFTVFRNVSIARTGEMIYGPGETPIDPGPDGLVHVQRTSEEVFRPETLASGNGAALVIDHPEEDVQPHNWQILSNGFFVDLRRGSGDQKDELLADLMVTTPRALSEIDSSKREVSVGYDADYFKTGEGQAEQRNIVINHVALVEAGRCGPRCAIRDHAHNLTSGACHMKKSIRDRILDAFKSKDEEGMKKALEEVKDEEPESGATHIHVHTSGAEAKPATQDEPEDPTEKRFRAIEDSIKGIADSLSKSAKDAESEEAKRKEEEEARKKSEDEEMEGELEEEAPEGTKDRARKARDSAYLVEPFETVKMQAEIIAPGVKIPTFDRASDPKATFRDCICGLRRNAIRQGLGDSATAGIIEQVRGKAMDSAAVTEMPCGQVRTLFGAVYALKKAANNATVGAGTAARTTDAQITPIQKFQAASRARWGKK